MIDENRILNTLKDLSFPRLSGTVFEKECFNKVKGKVEELNLSPEFQEFSFSIFYSRIYPRLTLTSLSWLLFILFLNLNLIFNLINLIVIVSSILFLIKITRNPEKIRIGKKYYSQNLYIKIPSKSRENSSENNIFLFSHLDSKGQKFPIKIRIQLYYGWVITFPLGLLVIIINTYYLMALLLYIFEILLLGINIIVIILLWVNITDNSSPGAIDNATGISCVLELLHFFSNPKNKLLNYNIWFVFTGAEESGTMGVRNFYQIIKYLDREKSYIVNFDSIATHAYLWDHGLLNNKYYKSFNYILENREILTLIKKTHRFYIGTYSDGLFLMNKKFNGLGNGDKSYYNYIHSENDSIEKIDVKVLKRLCQFYTILFNEVDNNQN